MKLFVMAPQALVPTQLNELSKKVSSIAKVVREEHLTRNEVSKSLWAWPYGNKSWA